jgi:hypothetical protein
VSISSTFYKQFLSSQIPKAQKRQSSCKFFVLLGSSCKTLMKLTPGRYKKGTALGFASLYVSFLKRKNITIPFTAEDLALRIRDVSFL